jgi:hypothetical protein
MPFQYSTRQYKERQRVSSILDFILAVFTNVMVAHTERLTLIFRADAHETSPRPVSMFILIVIFSYVESWPHNLFRRETVNQPKDCPMA